MTGSHAPSTRAGPTVRSLLRALTGALALGVLAACAVGPPSGAAGADDDALVVVASMSVLADHVRQVAGDRARVASLVPVGADPHTHEPTPADARAVADADLVVANGAGLEPWVDALLEAADTPVVWASEGLGGEVVGDPDGRPDPHLWMVPAFVALYAQTVAEALADLDPEGRDAYLEGAASYADDLADLDREIVSALEEIPDERRVLVTPHDAYGYFADAYDLEVATVVGVSTEEEPSAAAVQRLVDEVRERGVPTVFVETTVNRAVIDRVAADAGVEVGDPLYGDSLGEPGSGADTYVGMMRANVEALVAGLEP